MTSELLLNRSTRLSLSAFLANPSHSLIIEGKFGAGKSTFADHLAIKLLNISAQKLASYPYMLRLKPQGQSISIDDIRKAQTFLKLKTAGSAEIRRILIIEQAEKMTIEAQNAFLKILEEPPADTVLIILTTQKIKLLPTIRSRAQSLDIKPVPRDEISNYFAAKGHDQAKINSAFYAGNAQVGLIATILAADADEPTLKNLEMVKNVLSMTVFERLVFADDLIKQKIDISDFLNALITICNAALKQTIDSQDLRRANRWHLSLKQALEAQAKLAANPNTKLLLTDLLINL